MVKTCNFHSNPNFLEQCNTVN